MLTFPLPICPHPLQAAASTAAPAALVQMLWAGARLPKLRPPETWTAAVGSAVLPKLHTFGTQVGRVCCFFLGVWLWKKPCHWEQGSFMGQGVPILLSMGAINTL